MYYLLNYAFTMFMVIAIALVYNKTAPSGFIVAFILIAACWHLLAAAYATSKYNALKDRIKKLENKKEDE